MDSAKTEKPRPDRLKRPTLLVGGFLLAVVSMAAVAAKDGSIAQSPFVWLDVVIVSVLCAMPFALAVTERTIAGIPRVVAVVGSLLVLSAAREFMAPYAASSLLFRGTNTEWDLALARLIITVSACLAGTTLVAALWPRNRGTAPRWRREGAIAGPLLLAVAAFVPEAYLDARCRRERERMLEFAGSDRVTDALRVAETLAMLRPGDTVEVGSRSRKISIARYAAILQQQTGELEQQLAGLPRSDDPAVRLQRGRLLAQLSRRDEAVRELLPAAESKAAQKLDACLLLGTIHEHSEDWETSLAWYQQALDAAAESIPRASTDQLAAGLKGVAYASRKLGRYPDAELRYEALIELAPTAENHYLLAQFYRDAQQGEKARQHARQAIQLAPHRFKKAGEELIDDVVSNDFGCFGAFLRELQSR